MPRSDTDERMITQTYAVNPSRISLLQKLSIKEDRSVSKILRDAIDLYSETHDTVSPRGKSRKIDEFIAQ
jgi:hypothetical protein